MVPVWCRAPLIHPWRLTAGGVAPHCRARCYGLTVARAWRSGGSMTKTIWTSVCTAIVGLSTAALIAQTPAVPQNPSATDQITVTGCLKEAPATAAAPGPPVAAAGTGGTTGTTGTAGAATDSSASQPKFVLTDASAAPAADPSAGAATTASPAPGAPSPSDTQTYRLVANPAALSPHVGKKLELTGTLESPGSAAQTAAAQAGPANSPILTVKSGKIIAASCSQ